MIREKLSHYITTRWQIIGLIIRDCHAWKLGVHWVRIILMLVDLYENINDVKDRNRPGQARKT